MRASSLWLILGLLTACSEAGVTKFNAVPEAELSSHADGDTVREGDTATLRGTVGDADDDLSTLSVSWTVNGAEVCPGTVPGDGGLVTCEHTFGADDALVVLEVRDPGGASASDRAQLTITPTDAPTAAISAPEVLGRYYSDQLIRFAGLVGDAEDAPNDLAVRWETDALGDLGLDVDITSEGAVESYGALPEGTHAVRLRVTDSTGKEAVDSVVIEVGPPNSAPACALVLPADGAAGPEGEMVYFEGTVSDADVAANSLAVTWQSDRDGALGSSIPNTDGSVRFAWDALSVATHLITMTVRDEVGATCTDSVYYSVGTPPNLVLDAPFDGDIVNEGDDLRFIGTVSDGEDLPTDIDLQWMSDLDGLFSTQGADSTGAINFREGGLSAGEHQITVTATDTDGLYTTQTIGITVNAPPTAPTVTLSPDPAGTADSLTATATGSVDPDGSGIVSYTYTWYEDGALSSASTSSVFPASATTKHHAYRVVVTPFDGLADGPAGLAELTVDNTDPALSGPSLSASTVSVGDTLTCTASATDADPTDSPTLSYAWSDGTTGPTRLTTAADNPGDTITCTATADDGDGGRTSASVSATVANTDPVLAAVSLLPANPKVGDTLTCASSATDADGGSPTLRYAWSTGASGPTLVVSASEDPGDVITCTVTATDADGGTDVGNASVTVANSDPVIASVTISPTTATNDDTLTCTVSASDADGGSPSLSYTWTDTTTGATLGSGSSLDLSTVAVASKDTVRCTVTAADADGGSASASASLTVDNRAPTLSLGLSPAAPTAADTLTCAATAADADGDTVSTSFAWTVNGSAATATSTAATSSTLRGAFAYGGLVVCAATTSDGKGGVATASASVSITNAAPVISSVTVTPTSPTTNSTLSASAVVSDPEGDPVTTTWDWYVDGALVLSGASSTLSGALYFDKDEVVVAIAKATDGVNTTTRSSSSITVLNSPPGAPALSITPTSPSAGDSLRCAIATGSADADLDGITYTITWSVDGIAYVAGGRYDASSPVWVGPSTTTWATDTVNGADVLIGQTWTCTATPNDGDDDGTVATASVTTFDAVEFTTCGKTGTAGPSQAQCNAAYLGTDLAGAVTVTSGIQYWVVPATGTYRITGAGAQGGTNTGNGFIGGYGAEMSGLFTLTAGETLAILVGQAGSHSGTSSSSEDAGGGGGSFVVRVSGGAALLVAGGGGGGGENDDNTTNMTLYKNGVTSTCGQNAPAHGGGTVAGGCSGNGGGIDVYLYGQGGGGGFLGDGLGPGPGKAYKNGGAGNGKGGFGGGANGGGDGGGGAGGYSGGAGGSGGGSPDGPGGGGGSYNAGTSQTNTAGANPGDGWVLIEAP